MWMSHGDKVTTLPNGFEVLAATEHCPTAAIGNVGTKMFGLQFHPEVTHSLKGKELLANFVLKICGAPQDWNMAGLAERFIEQVGWMDGWFTCRAV
jgi:GMP synthase (glutamine-hydrolysing)